MPEFTVDYGEAIMHVGKLAAQGEPDLNLRRTSPVRRAIYSRRTFVKHFLDRILLRLVPMCVGEEPDVVRN